MLQIQTLDKIYEDNPFMISVLGDFNAKSHNSCKNDITFHEGSMIDAATSNYGLHKLIQEPTHVLNSSSSCIDLIFTSQPNLVMELVVNSSQNPNCHHQVLFAKFNPSILFPPPYERTAWSYEKANPELIRRAINEFDWIRALSNVSIDKKVCYFTETLLNITLLNNSSVLPNNLAKLTNKSLDTVNFTTDDIFKIINNLDPNKAHGHDMLIIRMIKLCGNSICKPLSITFNCLKEGKLFPSDWKKNSCCTCSQERRQTVSKKL